MSRVQPISWGALLAGANRSHHNRVWFGPMGGALVDLSDYLLPGLDYKQAVDAPIDALTLVMDRSIGSASLSPLMTALPPIDLGFEVLWEEAVTAQGAAPASGDWMEMFRGRVHGIDPTSNAMSVQCLDFSRRLQQLFTLPGQTYLTGASLQSVMQEVLDDAPGTTVTLDVPSSPGATLVQDLTQGHEPLLQAQLTLAASIGWQARHWWHEAGAEFRFSLLEPPRTKTTPDWTTGPNRYLAVPELKLDDADIRNHITVYYGPKLADGEQASVVELDQDSIDKYGLIPMVLREGTDSPVQTEAQATELALAAVSDLSEPQVTHTIEDFDLPHLQIWDLIQLTANNVHYNATQTLAVQTIRRYSPAPGVMRCALGMRGKPSAGIGVWKRRERSGRITEVIDTPDPLSLYGLLDFEEIPSSGPGKRRWRTIGAPRVATIWWNFGSFTTPFVADNYATIRAGVAPLPAGQGYVEFDEVSGDKNGILRVEPRLLDGSIYPHPKIVEEIQVYPVPLKIEGWIDARYVTGVLNVYAGANPTASALPIAYEIRADSQVGSVLASGSFTSLAAAVAGVGGSGALTALVPPADGKKFWFAKFTDVAGNEQWASDSVENAVKPRILKIRQAAGATNLSSDVYVTVESPMGRDISLKVWTNKANTNEPDPAGAVDETLTQAFTAGTPGSVEFGPPASSLDNVPVWPGRGKVIYLEAVDELGLTTGIQPFSLHSWLDIIGADGELIDDAIDRPGSIAASIRPPHVGTTAPDPADNPFWWNTNLNPPKLARWDGAVWDYSVDGNDLIAGSVIAGKVAAGVISTTELAAFAVTAAKLNVAAVFVSGMTLTDNSPGGGSVAWSACTVIFEGVSSSVSGGNTADAIVWWDRTSPTAFRTSTSNDDLLADGFDDVDGDAIIVLNEGGDAREVWNGTLIYGGLIKTNAIQARHIASYTMEVGKYIQSSNYVAGVSGWKLEDDLAEFVDVVIQGTVKLREDVAGEEVEFYTADGVTKIGGISATDFGDGTSGMQITNSAGGDIIAVRTIEIGVGTYSAVDMTGNVTILSNGAFTRESRLSVNFNGLGIMNIQYSPDTDSNGKNFLVAG